MEVPDVDCESRLENIPGMVAESLKNALVGSLLGIPTCELEL